jgi:hypothetical protein
LHPTGGDWFHKLRMQLVCPQFLCFFADLDFGLKMSQKHLHFQPQAKQLTLKRPAKKTKQPTYVFTSAIKSSNLGVIHFWPLLKYATDMTSTWPSCNTQGFQVGLGCQFGLSKAQALATRFWVWAVFHGNDGENMRKG